MTVIDILFRVDEICKKYERYDPERQREASASADDAFARLYTSVEDDIDKALEKAEKVYTEKNRAAAVALNAEVRRTKARLMEEVPKLQKLAKKKVKGLSKEEQETRFELVLAIIESIKAIPDGSTPGVHQTGGRGTSSSDKNIKFDSSEECFESDFYSHSEESDQFRNEYELRRKKQDEGLDVISEGLDKLKNIALDMNEELDRQVPLMDEIDKKVDQTTSDLRKNNVRLKETINQVRSSRNFCIDIVLIFILLGIALYLYK
ncbi:syntaxin of plants 72 [Hibiscus trionum]|uniref:Syntaxin of plants 72 n=1 Tax=Hibiscus trionum TaxID=183268 RepID=A0A9W7IJK9_HIBTR|nr:syntaxin of plants 72 [Hibiscus trionum]